MGFLVSITNGLTMLALLGLVALIMLMKREGNDERTHYMWYRMFRFLFVFLWFGLALLILVTAWKTIDYALLRVCITSLSSLTIFVGLGYWIYISNSKKLN